MTSSKSKKSDQQTHDVAQIKGGNIDGRVGAVPGPDTVNRHVSGPGTKPGSMPGLACLKWDMCKRGYMPAALKWRTVGLTNPDRPFMLEFPCLISHRRRPVQFTVSKRDCVRSFQLLDGATGHWLQMHCLQLWQREERWKVDAENRQFNKEWTDTFCMCYRWEG